jgi:hypothetical protein
MFMAIDAGENGIIRRIRVAIGTKIPGSPMSSAVYREIHSVMIKG